ncbi:uncharacterized protein LOC108021942 [Drosophila biarmipes]|uniref:uncharacterized protein LOC108021942 n=1 Tax=Drosophila biarmipes TaxID=125945 RepID=UPI0007E72F20|nr:uncharacterized protein LOC108021942 [Drosophila biarmipes]
MSQQNAEKVVDDEQCVRCSHCMKVVRCSRYDTAGLIRHIELEHPDLFADASAKIRHIRWLLSSGRGSSGSGGSMTQTGRISNLSDAHTADGGECDKVKKRNSADAATRKPPTSTVNLGARKPQPGPCSQNQAGRKPKDNPCGTPKDLSRNKNHSYPKTKDHSSPATKTLPCPRTAPCCISVEELRLIRQASFKASVNKWCAYEGILSCPACGFMRRPVIKRAAEVDSGRCSWLKCLFPCLARPDEGKYLYCAKCMTFLGVYTRKSNSLTPNKEYA